MNMRGIPRYTLVWGARYLSKNTVYVYKYIYTYTYYISVECNLSVPWIIFREISQKMSERRGTEVESGKTNFEYIL